MAKVRQAVLIVTCVAAVFGTGAAANAQTPAYTFTKIEFPGAISTEPHGINNAGQIVGTYIDASGIPHGFLFDGTTYTEISFPGAIYNYALGISNSGQILGSHSFHTSIGPYHAFLTEGDQYIEFDFPGKESDARAMNASGQIVGVYNAGFGTKDFGFLRTGDTYTSLDVPGASFTYALGINDGGAVTGSYRDSFLRLRGFTYVNGIYKSVSFVGATETYLGGLNNLNTAVGWSIQNGSVGAYVFSQGRTFQPIKANLAGAANTKPRAINDAGVIVGTYTSPECPVLCGFLARPNPAGTPVCSQSTALSYQAGTLNFSFNVRTTIPTTWTAWLILQNVPFRAWSVAVPVLSTPASGVVPIGLPPSGIVTMVSIFSTPADGNLCVEYSVVNTGPPAP